LAEQLTFNQRVLGSSPRAPTRIQGLSSNVVTGTDRSILPVTIQRQSASVAADVDQHGVTCPAFSVHAQR
jgi:hypothetical protein